MDDLDFGIRGKGVIQSKVPYLLSNTFDWIANKSMPQGSKLCIIMLWFIGQGSYGHIMICSILSQSPKGVLRKVTNMLSLQLSKQPFCHQFLQSNFN